MPRSFAVTWDYRCPFARNVHTTLVEALRDGYDWDVEFRPFSLDQVHVAAGEPPVWDRPPGERGTGVLSLQWGVVVRERFPDSFLDFHAAVFAARFDEGRKIGKEEVLRDVAAGVGLDPEAVAEELDDGWPLERVAAEHDESVERWSVFGVPTFIVGDQAAFVRLMEPHRPDDVERVLDLMTWDHLNELKRTRIPR